MPDNHITDNPAIQDEYRLGDLAHDGLLAGPELESDAELSARGWLKPSATAAFEGPELAPEYPESEPVYFKRMLLADLLQTTDPEVAWHLPYVAPAGCITLLTGDPKVGKSHLLWSMLSESLHDNAVFGEPVVPGMTVHILTEERPRSLRRIADKVKATDRIIETAGECPWYVTPYHDLDVHDWPMLLDQAAATWQLEPPAPDLLIVDTLGVWAGGADWNDYGQVMTKMESLGRLSKLFPNMAIVVIHHARKSGGDAVSSSLGSAALTAAVDNIVAIDEPDGGDECTRRLRFIGRVEPDGLADGEKWVRWDAETGFFTRTKRNGAAEAMIGEALLSAEGPLSPADIFDLIPDGPDKPSKRTIQRTCKQGYDGGMLNREGGKGKAGHRYWLSVNGDHPVC